LCMNDIAVCKCGAGAGWPGSRTCLFQNAIQSQFSGIFAANKDYLETIWGYINPLHKNNTIPR